MKQISNSPNSLVVIEISNDMKSYILPIPLHNQILFLKIIFRQLISELFFFFAEGHRPRFNWSSCDACAILKLLEYIFNTVK